MHILHHCNHESALSARIEKTYLSKTREDVKTWFEFGELDDCVSFGGKA